MQRTPRKDIIVNNDINRPAGSWNRWIPNPPYWCALDPVEESAEADGDVHGDEHEPDASLRPPRSEAKHGKSETCLGPGRTYEKQRAGGVDRQDKPGEVLKRKVPNVQSVSEADAVR